MMIDVGRHPYYVTVVMVFEKVSSEREMSRSEIEL